MTLVLTLPCCHLECKQTCVSKSANVLVFVDDYLPQQQQYQQNLDISTDFITRLTRSIGRKHKFKLVRNNSVRTFPNIQNFMGALRSTSSSSGLSNDRNVFDIDLKSGSVNIAMIIGLPSKELFQQRSDRLAAPTYIIGIKELRKDVLEQIVPSTKSFLVQNINMSTQIVKALALEMCSGCEDVDLYFLLDTSNSIGPEKFQRECKLASDLIKSMGMKNGHSSITTVDYSDTPELHAYTDITQFPYLVLSKTWRGGNTMTHHALEMVLKASAGKTKNRRQVGILMSDGASTSPDRTERSALKVHKTQLEMFTIGMGEDVNVDELKMIASKPSNMFMEKSVTVDNIAQAVCNGAIIDKDNEVPSNNQDCRGAFDIVFVLDSSWSLNSEKNFQKELRFVTEFASDLRFDFNQASASVITYADEAEEYTFHNGKDFEQTVLNLPWIGGNTHTEKAINILLQHVERKANSVQQDFERPLVVILISDGGSTSPFRLEEVVSRLKKYKFVKLFAIGVGVSINTKELLMIASDPSDNYMFMVDDLGVNNKILKSLLTSQICRDAKYLSLVSPTAAFSCPSHADVVFVLDSSSSLGIVGNPDVNFRKEVAFVIDVIKQGRTDFRKSRVSVITFSDVMTLNQYFNEDDLINNITRLPFLGGNTYTDIALELMLDELKYLSTISQARKPAIGIVLTDGHSTRPELTSRLTRRIQESGFRILAIGVSSHVDMRELTDIASSPKSNNVYLLDSIDLQNSFLPSLYNNC